MTTPVQYSNSGPRITVNDAIRSPMLIARRMLRLIQNQFVMETVLRRAGGAEGGVIAFEESTPLFAADDAAIVEEGGEIPLTTGMRGKPRSVHTIKMARGVEITREMRDRQRIDLLNQNMTQVRNTFVRTWDLRMFKALETHPDVPVIPAGTVWATSTVIRDVVFDAQEVITQQVADPVNRPADFLGFAPDTMVMPVSAHYDLLRNVDFSKIYEGGNIADRNIRYTGRLERQMFGMNILVSRTMAPGKVLILERETVGGWSDERPMEVGPTYPDPDREVWRANAVRRTGIFIDQPKAAAWITGV